MGYCHKHLYQFIGQSPCPVCEFEENNVDSYKMSVNPLSLGSNQFQKNYFSEGNRSIASQLSYLDGLIMDILQYVDMSNEKKRELEVFRHELLAIKIGFGHGKNIEGQVRILQANVKAMIINSDKGEGIMDYVDFFIGAILGNIGTG